MTRPELDASEHHADGPSDALLDALLDEALAPPKAPGDLAQRIFQRTQPALRSRGRGVLARLGPRPVRWAAAAVILLAWTGAWMVAGQIAKNAYSEAAIDQHLDRLAQYAGPSDTIDQELNMLADRIELAVSEPAGSWEATHRSLESAISEWEEQMTGEGSQDQF